MLGRMESRAALGEWAGNRPSVVTGIAAAGSTQATATQLTADVNVVASGTATTADGVRLPKAVLGDVVVVVNADDSTNSVWPYSGDNINALAADAEFTALTTGKTGLFIAVSDTKWVAFVSG